MPSWDFLKAALLASPIFLISTLDEKGPYKAVLDQGFDVLTKWYTIAGILLFILALLAYQFRHELEWFYFKEVPAKRDAHSACVIWMHGLGDSGLGMSWFRRKMASEMRYLKVSLPTAPKRYVTLRNGRVNAWFDVHRFPIDAEEPHDEPNMADAVDRVLDLVNAEVAGGIPSERIVLGGFSQGAAVALCAAAKSPTKLGGVVLWSGYVTPAANLVEDLRDGVNRGIACFCGYGDMDERISEGATKQLTKILKESNVTLTSRSYKGMGHHCTPEELTHTVEFLRTAIPEKPASKHDTRKSK